MCSERASAPIWWGILKKKVKGEEWRPQPQQLLLQNHKDTDTQSPAAMGNIPFSARCTQRLLTPICEGIRGDSERVNTWIQGTCRGPVCSQTYHTWPTLAPKGDSALPTLKWGNPHFHCSLAHQKPCFPCSSPWLCWGLRGFFLPFLSLRMIICPHYQALHILISE